MKPTQSILAFAVTALLSLLHPAHAADGIWNTTTSGALWSAAGNWSGSIIADGSGFTADFNSLNPTADTTVNLDSARTLGNLIFGDTNTSTAASWILANNATPTNILTLNVASGTPTVTVNALGTGKSTTISAVIDGTQGLQKNGSGTLILSGTNTFSGGLTINAGTLTTSNSAAAGATASDITLNGGTLNMGTAVGNSVNVTANSSLTLGNNTFWSGALKGNSGTTLTISVGGTASPQGDWSSVGGTLLFTGANTLRPNISGGTTFGSANAIWDFGSSTIGVAPRHSASGGSDITFKMGALKSTGTGMTLTSNSNLSGGRVIYEVGALNQDTTYNGTISENAAHKVALTKVGTGTLTLSAVNIYSGTTTVSAGKLTIASTGSVNNSSGITISGGNFNYNSSTTLTPAITFSGTGGTLSGSGTVGAFTLTSGNTISPGNSPGTLITGNQVWNGGATYTWEINNATGAQGTNWDFISSTGSLDLSALSTSSKFNLSVIGLTAGNVSGAVPNWTDANASWKIASFTSIVGTFASNLFNVDSSGFTNNNTAIGVFTVTNSGNDLYLTYAAIPEPSTYAAIFGALALAGVVLRRRRRAA